MSFDPTKGKIERAFKDNRQVSAPAAITCWICEKPKRVHRYMGEKGSASIRYCLGCDGPIGGRNA